MLLHSKNAALRGPAASDAADPRVCAAPCRVNRRVRFRACRPCRPVLRADAQNVAAFAARNALRCAARTVKRCSARAVGVAGWCSGYGKPLPLRIPNPTDFAAQGDAPFAVRRPANFRSPQAAAACRSGSSRVSGSSRLETARFPFQTRRFRRPGTAAPRSVSPLRARRPAPPEARNPAQSALYG